MRSSCCYCGQFLTLVAELDTEECEQCWHDRNAALNAIQDEFDVMARQSVEVELPCYDDNGEFPF